MPLMPARVKYRKMHRGNRAGMASRGYTVSFGEYGLQSLERCWLDTKQIEAARVAGASGLRIMLRHLLPNALPPLIVQAGLPPALHWQLYLPVVLVSSKNQESDRAWGKRQGADDYLAKPWDDDKLVVAGYTWNGSNYDVAMARYNSSGSLDTSFGSGGRPSEVSTKLASPIASGHPSANRAASTAAHASSSPSAYAAARGGDHPARLCWIHCNITNS